ncbi:MAG: ComEC/Rec2 family competence protein [Acidobacteriota bacterium]
MPRRLSFTRLSLPQQPLVFLALAFLGGLLGAARSHFPLRNWWLIAVIAWACGGVALCLKRTGWWVTVALLVGVLAVGGALWTLNDASAAGDRVRTLLARGELSGEEPIELWGTLDAAPELAPERIYLSLAVERVATFGREWQTRGAVQIVVPFHDDEARAEYDQLRLDYGVRVRVLGQLSKRSGYRNPGAPDFSELLEQRGYDATGWVKSPLLLERLGDGKRNAILAGLYRLRARGLAVTLRHFKQPASGILAAALFGNRYFIARDTAELFRAGGTFHLLVISGLHVALIAGVALWLARYLSRVRWLQYLLVIVLMWAYALMVGAQPAITRAVVMLTIALLGQLLFRAAVGANTLAAAALVLLAWQPRDLFNAGFQLSFLTVLMIVVLTGPLYERLKLIGEWQPSRLTPYPPRVPRAVKWMAELLFWRETAFRAERRKSRIRFRLEKARAAYLLDRLRVRTLSVQSALTWVLLTLLTTVGVQVGLLPLMLTHFHRVSVVAPLANVVESLLVFALMLAGTAYLLLQAVLGAWVSKLAGVVNWLGWLTVRAGEPLLVWRKASLRVPDWGESSVLVFAVYFAAVVALIVLVNEWNPFRKGDDTNATRRRLGGRLTAVTALLVLFVLSWLLVTHPFPPQYDAGRLTITFLDVGQGDAILLSFPRGKLLLLDSGGRIAFDQPEEAEGDDEVFVEDRIGIAEAAVMPYLWRRGIQRLDWIAASHGDADHVEGFGEIARSFAVGQALRGVGQNPAPVVDPFTRAVTVNQLPLRELKRGDELEIDGVRLAVLSPFAENVTSAQSDNNASLVLRVSFGARSFLLTGDIEKQAEARLVAAETELRADVLKVAHHGSKTSSTAEFLARVQPQHAVISAAHPNPFGHPHADVVTRLRLGGARLWQTSQCGAITFSTDGQDLRVDTFVKCE